MARRPRIEFSGASYHVMSRGDHGEAIFDDDEDRNPEHTPGSRPGSRRVDFRIMSSKEQ